MSATNADDLRDIYLASVRHFKAIASAPPGTHNAATLETLRKWLADQGVNAQTLESLDRLDPVKRNGDLAGKFKDYDGDKYGDHDGDNPA